MSDSGALVYVVDDDASAREGVAALIRSAGLRPKTFASAEDFLAAPRPKTPSCLVLDVSLPGVSGLDLQRELATSSVQIPIVFLTGHGDIPMTVRALKAGAANFLTKPFDDDDLLNSIHQCMKVAALEHRTRTLEQSLKSARRELHDRYGFEQIIGRSPLLRDVLTRAAKVARTETTVLLTGESGTGKELVARAIHHTSPRADRPFVALNCAALPETLIESELFGHERGAFTGADRLKRGRFELAAGGTLFLDEIGELAAAAQAKILRVLQERRYERVGGATTLEADVRLIAATNRDPERAVAEGRLREDLYYRLNVFRIHLPALRERGEDVLLLADHFVRELGARMGKAEPGLSRAARDLLLAHSWPGNIRELQNAIERALIIAEDELIAAEHLGLVARPPRDEAEPAVAAPAVAAPPTETATSTLTVAEQEKRLIVDALRRTGGNKARAAATLGLSPTQLLRRTRRFGLDRQSP